MGAQWGRQAPSPAHGRTRRAPRQKKIAAPTDWALRVAMAAPATPNPTG